MIAMRYLFWNTHRNEQIKELISVDTLKTMQLLGFNYKAAIGEPLTQICADAISNMGSKNKTNTPTQKKRQKRKPTQERERVTYGSQ